MNSQFLHLLDPLTLEFDAQIQETIPLPAGRWGVVLDRTYFYATGGGQEHDTGSLGDTMVVDVYKESDPSPRVVHVVEQQLPLGPVHARIDGERRLRHMQHHTAQHLLSQCFLQQADNRSLSTNINGTTPSTLDIARWPTPDELRAVERLANQIIFEDRPVKTYFVTPDELRRLPLRWPPAVTENIRIVEIEGFDYTPCGGTHCTRTGMIGAVKILRAERQKGLTRLTFVAGWQALETFQLYQEIVGGSANALGVGPQEVTTALQKRLDQLKAAQQELQTLRLEKLTNEAKELAARREQIGACHLVVAQFEARPLEELRALAEALKGQPQTVSLLATSGSGQYSVIVVCAEDSGLSARDLLREPLAQLGGRGGGNPRVAQGGGAGDANQAKALIEKIRAAIPT